MDAAGVEAANADEQSVGYQLAPRMNAAGRLGDANDVVELLLTPSGERAAARSSASGPAAAGEAESFDHLRSWLAMGHGGQMRYLADRLDAYRHSTIIICVGQGAWEDGMRVDTAELRRCSMATGAPVRLTSSDWLSWRDSTRCSGPPFLLYSQPWGSSSSNKKCRSGKILPLPSGGRWEWPWGSSSFS